MYRNKKITLCLPCRNEAAHLGAVIKQVPKFVDEIIVISNGSTDDTVETARGLSVTCIEENRTVSGIGYGFAHMAGIKKATGDIILGADADMTYPIHDIKRIVDHLIDNELDFVSCARYPVTTGPKIPLLLTIGVKALNLEVRVLYGKKVSDILSGMWAFNSSIKPKLKLTKGEWNLSPQIKLNAMNHPDIRFGEFAIVQQRRSGTTHQNYFKTGFSHAFWIARNRLA